MTGLNNSGLYITSYRRPDGSVWSGPNIRAESFEDAEFVASYLDMDGSDVSVDGKLVQTRDYDNDLIMDLETGETGSGFWKGTE